MARVVDCLAGGTGYFPADQAEAARLSGVYPPLRALVHESRAFTGRVVTWAARQGIGQFADLGSGYPVSPAVHHLARGVLPRARVVYVDHDPVAWSHADALIDGEGLAAVQADLSSPGAVLGHAGFRRLINPARPVCVLLGLVLNLFGAGTAREIIDGYASRAAPGSVIAISVLCCDDEQLWERLREAFTAAPILNHARGQIGSFLGGLELIKPGVVIARGWRGGMPDPQLRPAGPAYVLGAAAAVPAR